MPTPLYSKQRNLGRDQQSFKGHEMSVNKIYLQINISEMCVAIDDNRQYFEGFHGSNSKYVINFNSLRS